MKTKGLPAWMFILAGTGCFICGVITAFLHYNGRHHFEFTALDWIMAVVLWIGAWKRWQE